MQQNHFRIIRNIAGLAALILASSISGQAQNTLKPDLKSIPQGVRWKGAISLVKLVEKDNHPAAEFNQAGAHLVWLNGFQFDQGTIEFDAKGQSAPPQSSFIGVAFHVVDEKNYDAVYFRPFNFRAAETERKIHAVQYISEPEWPWQRLRQEKTGQYEKPIDPAPDGDTWFHARIVVTRPKITVFVNGASTPSLIVDQLADRKDGSVGLWCNGYGVIANLSITPAP